MDNREFCAEMLAKLERPLSFIGERRQNFLVYEGQWTNIKNLITRASSDPKFKTKLRPALFQRLSDIKDDLRMERLTKNEAQDLYEEGIAIKRTIYLLDRSSMGIDEDRHGDTRRWLKYGRSISP